MQKKVIQISETRGKMYDNFCISEIRILSYMYPTFSPFFSKKKKTLFGLHTFCLFFNFWMINTLSSKSIQTEQSFCFEGTRIDKNQIQQTTSSWIYPLLPLSKSVSLLYGNISNINRATFISGSCESIMDRSDHRL